MHKVVGKLISRTTQHSLKISYVFIFVVKIYVSKLENQFDNIEKKRQQTLLLPNKYIFLTERLVRLELCEDSLSINLTLPQFLKTSIGVIRRSLNLKQKV